MTTQPVTVEKTVAAPVAKVWHAYTTPEDIMQWNTPSDDWNTPAATIEFREGGAFSSRMEASYARKKVEMPFAHLKRILRLDRLRLRGPNGAKDEFQMAATV